MENKKNIARYLIQNGILITPEVVSKLNDEKILKEANEIIESELFNNKIAMLKKILEIEDYKVNKDSEDNKKEIKTSVEVIFSYKEESKKRDIQDFVSYFNKRLSAIEKILQKRTELSSLTSINRILQKKDKENVSFVGIVTKKETTKNGNIILYVEDSTGTIRVIVNKNKQNNFDLAKTIVLDEVIGVTGVNNEKIVFANEILLPDVPLSKELKKSPDEIYALFLSDIHVGSNNFLENEFLKFIKWLNGEIGSDSQKEIIDKIGYIFIVGDLVDGVGIYPNQEKELSIPDIFEQYKECARLLSMIPKHIKVIVCPGNHDAMRIAEPQPEFYKDFSAPLYDIPNLTIVSNPAFVNIHKSKDFPGFDVLMYHGYCFDYYVANVDFIRENGGYDRADLIMKFLLQRRHLAPTHSSTLYIPDANKDPLVIDRIPDIFITGHIHKCSVSNYRNVTLVCGSCWQSKTDFQEKVGHNPEPCRVPIINLQTRMVKVLKF